MTSILLAVLALCELSPETVIIVFMMAACVVWVGISSSKSDSKQPKRDNQKQPERDNQSVSDPTYVPQSNTIAPDAEAVITDRNVKYDLGVTKTFGCNNRITAEVEELAAMRIQFEETIIKSEYVKTSNNIQRKQVAEKPTTTANEPEIQLDVVIQPSEQEFQSDFVVDQPFEPEIQLNAVEISPSEPEIHVGAIIRLISEPEIVPLDGYTQLATSPSEHPEPIQSLVPYKPFHLFTTENIDEKQTMGFDEPLPKSDSIQPDELSMNVAEETYPEPCYKDEADEDRTHARFSDTIPYNSKKAEAEGLVPNQPQDSPAIEEKSQEKKPGILTRLGFLRYKEKKLKTLDIEINGLNVTMVIDKGSFHSAVSLRIWRQLGEPKLWALASAKNFDFERKGKYQSWLNSENIKGYFLAAVKLDGKDCYLPILVFDRENTPNFFGCRPDGAFCYARFKKTRITKRKMSELRKDFQSPENREPVEEQFIETVLLIEPEPNASSQTTPCCSLYGPELKELITSFQNLMDYTQTVNKKRRLKYESRMSRLVEEVMKKKAALSKTGRLDGSMNLKKVRPRKSATMTKTLMNMCQIYEDDLALMNGVFSGYVADKCLKNLKIIPPAERHVFKMKQFAFDIVLSRAQQQLSIRLERVKRAKRLFQESI